LTSTDKRFAFGITVMHFRCRRLTFFFDISTLENSWGWGVLNYFPWEVFHHFHYIEIRSTWFVRWTYIHGSNFIKSYIKIRAGLRKEISSGAQLLVKTLSYSESLCRERFVCNRAILPLNWIHYGETRVVLMCESVLYVT
jgi:hypothetical protein